MSRVTLILGGARSGKSARALALAEPPRVFVATAQALDREMAERIARHKAERGGDWDLVEEALDLFTVMMSQTASDRTMVIDCLTLWLSNMTEHGWDVEAETARLTEALGIVEGRVILISNEIGLGLVPADAASRAFRDAQGRLNQVVAAAADRVEFIVAGLPVVLKGGA